MINYSAKYVHGSEDSLDIDTYYIVESIPSFAEAKMFCDSIKGENANLISIKNGEVAACYKGTVDEVNNSLFYTYNLHHQDFDLLVTHTVERDKYLKYIRAIRGILSHLSRSIFRDKIKIALRSYWDIKLCTLDSINLQDIKFEDINKHISGLDTIKVIAFQIGQSLGLTDGIELYTKSSIAEKYPTLKSYLYREGKDLADLDKMMHTFIQRLREINYIDIPELCYVQFDKNHTYNLKLEKRIF